MNENPPSAMEQIADWVSELSKVGLQIGHLLWASDLGLKA